MKRATHKEGILDKDNCDIVVRNGKEHYDDNIERGRLLHTRCCIANEHPHSQFEYNDWRKHGKIALFVGAHANEIAHDELDFPGDAWFVYWRQMIVSAAEFARRVMLVMGSSTTWRRSGLLSKCRDTLCWLARREIGLSGFSSFDSFAHLTEEI